MKAGPRLGPQCLDGRRRTSCGGFPRISFRSACPSLLCCPGGGQRQAAWLGTMAQGAFEHRKHPMDGPTHAGFPHSEVGLPTGDSPEEFFVRSGDLISPSRDQACCPNLDLEWQAGSRPRIRSAAQKVTNVRRCQPGPRLLAEWTEVVREGSAQPGTHPGGSRGLARIGILVISGRASGAEYEDRSGVRCNTRGKPREVCAATKTRAGRGLDLSWKDVHASWLRRSGERHHDQLAGDNPLSFSIRRWGVLFDRLLSHCGRRVQRTSLQSRCSPEGAERGR